MNPQQPTTPVSYNSGGSSKKGLFTTIVLVVLLIASLAFGAWAFKNMQDYKNNSDKKAAVAVANANKIQAAQLQAKYDKDSKSPFKVFSGSPTYGTITFNYPKTWSAYVDTSNSSEPINAYFYPGEVPGIQSKTAYALRVELVSTDYAQAVQQLSSGISGGKVTARAYIPPMLSGVANIQAGTLFSGQINSQDPTQVGTMVVIKVRDKTLQISTQSSKFLDDFNSTILSSLTFAP